MYVPESFSQVVGSRSGHISLSPRLISSLFLSAAENELMRIDVSLIDAETEDALGFVALPLSLIANSRTLDDWFTLAPAKKPSQLFGPNSGSPGSGVSPLAEAARLGQLHIKMQSVTSEERLKYDAEEKLKEDSRRREREIFKLFSVEEEPYIKEFSCALEKKILHQGRLYVTPHYVMFSAPFAKKLISLDDIKSIERRKTAGVFNTAIAIITKDDKENVFKSFRKRGECIECLTHQMTALGKLVTETSSIDTNDEASEAALPGGEELDPPSPPKAARSSSAIAIPSKSASSTTLAAKMKRSSMPTHKKKRRRSDEPPVPVSEAGSSAANFSTSLPRDNSILAEALDEGDSSSSESASSDVSVSLYPLLIVLVQI